MVDNGDNLELDAGEEEVAELEDDAVDTQPVKFIWNVFEI
jgi:hypothetical protein